MARAAAAAPPAMIAAAPRLRLIQKIGVGVNTIDLDGGEGARHRRCATCPARTRRAVAEMTLLLMLAALRRLPLFDAATARAAVLVADPPLQDRLGELGGRTVGLVGYGAVPRVLAPVLAALGCRVLYTARTPQGRRARRVSCRSTAAGGGGRRVSLHLPLTPDTERMIDAARAGAHEAGRRADQHRARRAGGPDGAGRGAGGRAGSAPRGWTCSRTNRSIRDEPLFRLPNVVRDAARGLADHRHVRPQLRSGRRELPPAGDGRGAAAPGGLTMALPPVLAGLALPVIAAAAVHRLQPRAGDRAVQGRRGRQLPGAQCAAGAGARRVAAPDQRRTGRNPTHAIPKEGGAIRGEPDRASLQRAAGARPQRVRAARVPITITSLGAREEVNAAMHSSGGIVLHDVINAAFARKAIAKGADGLILVAAGAGGHAGTVSPFALVAEVRASLPGRWCCRARSRPAMRCWRRRRWAPTSPISAPPSSRQTKRTPMRSTSG